MKSVFVDGGTTPGGGKEVSRASLIVNYTPKGGPLDHATELELAISHQLDNVPDIRYWFVDENGLRAVSLVVTGADSALSPALPTISQARCGAFR